MPAQTNLVGGMTFQTVGGAVLAARQILNDTTPTTGPTVGGDLSGTLSTNTLGGMLTAIRDRLNDSRPVTLTTAAGVTPAVVSTVSATPISYTLGDVAIQARRLLNDAVSVDVENGNLSGMDSGLLMSDLVGDVRMMLGDPSQGTFKPAAGSSAVATVAGTNPGAFTVGGAVVDARSILNDTMQTAYRYSDVDLYAYFTDAHMMMRRTRPDLFVTDTDGFVAQFSPGDAPTPFPMMLEYYPAYVAFIAGRAQARDDTSADEVKAEAYAATFANVVMRGPYRYSDAYLLSMARLAFLTIYQRRLDLFVLQPQQNEAAFEQLQLTAAYPLADWTYALVADFMVGQALVRNDQFMAEPGVMGQRGQAMVAALSDRLEGKALRYSDMQVYSAMDEAFQAIYRLRPDLFLGGGTLTPFTDPTYGIPVAYQGLPQNGPDAVTPTVSFPLADEYGTVVIDFIVGRLSMRDGQGTEQRAQAFMASFAASLKAGPFRHADSSLYAWLNQALLHLRRRRPDLVLDGALTLTIYQHGDEATPFPLDDVYVPLVLDYVVAMAMRRDAMLGGDMDQVPGLLAGLDAQLDAAPYRYGDTHLYALLNEALGETRRLRPDLWLGLLRTPLPAYDPTLSASAFPVDETYYAPVVSYIVGRAQQRDRPGPDDGKAPGFLALFTSQMRA